jgi:hypothetical protein
MVHLRRQLKPILEGTVFVSCFYYCWIPLSLLQIRHSIIFVIFFQVSMILGIAGVAVAWIANGFTPPYNIPTLMFMLLSIFIPANQIFLPIENVGPGAFWATPVSLGILYLYGRHQEKEVEALKQGLWEREMHQVDTAFSDDKENAAAQWRKAELYESAKLYTQALEHYLLAGSVSPDGYPASAIRSVERRLEPLIQQAEAAKNKNRRAIGLVGRFGSMKRAAILSFVLLLPLLLGDWTRFAMVFSLWMFAAWCMRALRTESSFS